MTIINSRADLEALRGTPAFEQAIAAIYGASVRFVAVDGDWEEQTNPAAYEQFGYDAQTFAAEVAGLELPAPSAPSEPPPAPPVVTLPDLEPWRFRAMLEISGRKADVETFIDNLPQPTQAVARSKIEYSIYFKRDNDLILAAQAALGMTDQELDGLWEAALSL